jgi:general secretion pathway protein H
MRRRRGQGGYTLFEVMAVAAIAVGLVVVGGVAIRRVRQTDLRNATTRLGGAIRYTYDRAGTSGRYYRLVVDLDQKTYWPEASDDRFYLVRGPGGATTEDETDAPPTAKASSGSKSLLGGIGGGGDLPGGATPSGTVAVKVGVGKPRFAADTVTSKRQSAPLRGVTIDAVWTARLDQPVTQGRAYLYFYPEGRTERAIVHLSDAFDGVYSLVVHPLTGRVQIFAERIEIPRTGGNVDDTGEARP